MKNTNIERKPLDRRFYEVLSKGMYTTIGWLLALIVAISLEDANISQVSYTWFLITLPLYCIVMFGCYALMNIGYHMIVIEDCEDA